jgi:hypothetical protein
MSISPELADAEGRRGRSSPDAAAAREIPPDAAAAREIPRCSPDAAVARQISPAAARQISPDVPVLWAEPVL